jgi:nitric oxide synthase oxygenase domain/subunit
MYGLTRTPFPAAEQLLVTSLVSNALVGRLLWSSLAVKEQRALLLDPARISKAKKLIISSRIEMA